MKNNPDPAIAKYNQTPAIAPEVKPVLSSTPNDVDLPDLTEIPEIKQSAPVMEIL